MSGRVRGNQGDLAGPVPTVSSVGGAPRMLPLEIGSLRAAGVRREPRPLSSLVNELNELSFFGHAVFAHTRHRRTHRDYLTPVPIGTAEGSDVPLPAGEALCALGESYEFLGLATDDGLSITLAPGDSRRDGDGTWRVRLRDAAVRYCRRQARRHRAEGVVAHLEQDGAVQDGRLVDFSARGFLVRLALWRTPAPQSPAGLRAEVPLVVRLRRARRVVYEGSARLATVTPAAAGDSLVVLPFVDRAHRSREARRMQGPIDRSLHPRLMPPARLHLTHPVTSRSLVFQVHDLDLRTLSVVEEPDSAVLLPGLVIDQAVLLYGAETEVRCRLRVALCSPDRRGRIVSLLEILDVHIESAGQFLHSWMNAADPNASVDTRVDMDELWSFFFRSGLIYPKKLAPIAEHREAIRETYRRVYHAGQRVFLAMTHQTNGTIHAHAPILRAYDHTWMFHHLAAERVSGVKTGLRMTRLSTGVLFPAFVRWPSTQAEFVITYFRPNNPFPSWVFGGAVEALGDPGRCSADIFAYTWFDLEAGTAPPLRPGLCLEPLTDELGQVVRDRFARRSGGLALEALGVHARGGGCAQVAAEFSALGLTRESSIFVLLRETKPLAVFVVDRSDPALNLSELLNCIKAVVLEPGELPGEVLREAIAHLGGVYLRSSIPVLVHPEHYARSEGFAVEKSYALWVLRSSAADDFGAYVLRRTKRAYWKLLARVLAGRLGRVLRRWAAPAGRTRPPAVTHPN